MAQSLTKFLHVSIDRHRRRTLDLRADAITRPRADRDEFPGARELHQDHLAGDAEGPLRACLGIDGDQYVSFIHSIAPYFPKWF